MTPVPFTHHEILGVIEPFARRGWRADLAHTDRLARRLAFRPREHASGVAPARRECLELDGAQAGRYRLTRTLTVVGGLAAELVAEGADPAALLAAIEAVPHERQLRRAGGNGDAPVVALGHRLDAAGALRLVDGTAQAGGLTLVLTMPARGGRRADVALTTRFDDPVELPDDLLAVLGWDWSRLDQRTEQATRRWTGSVRLARRTDADAQAKLESAAAHLATTLAEPPARFHERLRRARWAFAFRRSIPFLVCIALLVGTFAFAKIGVSDESVMRMLVFNAPPLLLVAFFCLREVPRIELPGRPRRAAGATWRPGVEAADDATAASVAGSTATVSAHAAIEAAASEPLLATTR